MWSISVRPAARSRPCPEALPQCIVTRRSAPPSHGEKFHRRTIVTRRTAPPSHGIHPCIHPCVHTNMTSPQVFGPCPLLLLAARGLHRHTAADYIVTRLRATSPHAAQTYRHTVAYATHIYRHTPRTYIVTWCKTIRKTQGSSPLDPLPSAAKRRAYIRVQPRASINKGAA